MSDRITELERDLADVRATRDKLMELLRRPSLTLDPDDTTEVAWVAVGVHAGVISAGKARELLGGMDVLEWLSISMSCYDAIEALKGACDHG